MGKFVEAVDFTVCLFIENDYVLDLLYDYNETDTNKSFGNFLQDYF